MADFRVHDTAHSDRRIVIAGNAAAGVWARAGAWAAEAARPGDDLVVPRELLRVLGTTVQTARRLVTVDLWEPLHKDWRFLPALWSLDFGGRRPPIPSALRGAVLARDGYQCVRCAARGDLQMDHVYPWSLGGETAMWNLQTLCGPCNRAKGARVNG